MTDSLPSAGLHGLDRLRRYTWWFLVPYPPSAVAFGALEVLEDDRSVGELLVILGSFVLAGLVSVRWFETVTREEVRSPIRVRDWAGFGIACAGLIAAAIVANPFSDIGLGWLLLPGGLIAALVLRLPPRARFAALAGMVLATAVSAGLLSAAGHLPPQAMVLGPVFALVVASTLWIQWWSFDVARKLEQSRRVAGELAVAQERLRFAAELHDIQGHHLQVIALKSELAARLGPTRPEQSIAVMRDVQELARDALRDTRAVVAGYRKVTPHTEINNATRVLTAAGIRATARFPEADLESEALRELGLLIREST
ncbi:MAG: sensor histidine kinase, partial [Stackebrandtia sp.]